MNKPGTHISIFRPFAGKAVAMGLGALVAGCSMMPAYERPAMPVPSEWPATNGAAKSVATSSADAVPTWSTFVADANLHEVIALALAQNRDLQVATLNIEQVRAQYRIRRADQFPTVNLAASGNRQTTSADEISSSYSVGLALSSWEIDFFGRIASLKEVALAQYLASEDARRSAQTSLVAAVASTWLSLQTSGELLDLTQRTLTTREESLRLTRLRFDNGAASALDLRQAESLSAAARATLAQIERQRALDLNALNLLAGLPVPPALLAPALKSAQGPEVFTVVPPGLPSDLLTRRADIRQAEQLLVAANANIGAARAAFFPRISLTASVGTASSELSGLFKSGSWGWTLAPQALLPVFDAGRNQAGLDVATVSRDIAVAQYEKAIQTAFREVSDALAARASLQMQLSAQQAQADAEAERFRLADLRYRNGIANYLDVLDAQRSLFATQQGLVQTRLSLRQNQVALYKALGGGWEP